jgi:hypothetical protein
MVAFVPRLRKGLDMSYEQFDKATGNITAQALLLDGQPVGRIVIKFGAAATAYVQVWGSGMAHARATGYGYDKASAAVMDAISKLNRDDWPEDSTYSRAFAKLQETRSAWNGGARYTTALEAAGITLANVI